MPELDTAPPDLGSPQVPDTLPVGKTQDRLLPTEHVDPLSPEAYQRAVSGETDLYKKNRDKQEELERGETAAFEQYQARQERMLHAEGATADDMRPWNPQTMAPPPTNLWEKFGSPGFVIGLLASTFTGMPMVSGLNAAAAAMNAINEGDNEAYHRAFDTWKVNSELAIKRFNMEKDAFDQIDHLQKNSMTEWYAKRIALAARFNDERALVMLQNGMAPDVIKNQEAMATSVASITKAQKELSDNNTRLAIVRAITQDENGKLKPEYAKDPKKWAEATRTADLALKDETTALGIGLQQLQLSSEWEEAGSAEREKLIAKVVRDVSPYGRGAGNTLIQKAQEQTDAWREEQITAGTTPSDQEYADKFRENLSANAIAAQPVQAKRAETDFKRLQETIRHHEQEELAKKEASESKAAGGGISGNRADQIQRQIDAYDNNLQYITNIKAAIEKYHYSVGLAGKAGRAGERLADVLFGSTETDRVQIMRDLEKLKLGASRLLLDAEGRPLSASEHRVDDIIGGGSYGDLTANTLRSLDELEADYKNRRNQHNQRLPEKQRREPSVTIEKPTVTDKPASWDDIPSVTPE